MKWRPQSSIYFFRWRRWVWERLPGIPTGKVCKSGWASFRSKLLTPTRKGRGPRLLGRIPEPYWEYKSPEELLGVYRHGGIRWWVWEPLPGIQTGTFAGPKASRKVYMRLRTQTREV